MLEIINLFCFNFLSFSFSVGEKHKLIHITLQQTVENVEPVSIIA